MQRAMTTIRLATVVTVILAALTTVSASAAQPEPRAPAQSDPDGWVFYDNDDEPLADVTTKTYRGERVSTGGCQFSGSDILQPGSSIVVEREVAYNEGLCEVRVERGTLANPSLVGTGSVESSQMVEPSPDATVSTSSFVTTAAINRSKAYLKTYYEEPAQIDVDTTRPDVTWDWDGTCTVGTSYHHTIWDPFEKTGWYVRAYNQGIYGDCAVRTTSSFGHFVNGIFCLTVDTETFHDRSLVQGRANGSMYVSWNSYKRGGCNNLLSFNREYGFEAP
jgi:hypothetical protein